MSGLFAKAPNTTPYSSDAAMKSQAATAQAQAKYGTYGVDSPLGGLSLQQNPDGTYSKQFTQSDADVQRQGLIGQGLGGLSFDPTRAEDAYYSRATRQLNPQFDRQTENLNQQLANQGIDPNSEQGMQRIESLRNQQSGILSDISDKSVFAGQDLLGSQVGNIGALAGQRDIFGVNAMGGGTGASMQDTYSNQLQDQQQRQLAKHQARQERNEAIGNIAGTFAPMFSDIRYKENLKEVGKLENGLTVYVGNYNDLALEKDPSLNKKPQLFLIAQEVEKMKPEAVEKDENGYLSVDYKEASNGL